MTRGKKQSFDIVSDFGRLLNEALRLLPEARAALAAFEARIILGR